MSCLMVGSGGRPERPSGGGRKRSGNSWHFARRGNTRIMTFPLRFSPGGCG
ncbi:hypothetical protein C882_0925 [Caenispirillum salinarum AK4]|uniref:Uncharacterized protein n=1 Tax=Caenispirillum salinarum AK4 TaxID=1238182 RepID=K9HE09_9PROT|nr:hypothetical protein C882_0925 [Caenispirillum salinarum AK4]